MDLSNQKGVQQPKMKSSSKQLQLHVATVYNQIAAILQQRQDLEIQLPSQVPTAVERVNLIKSAVNFLLEMSVSENKRQVIEAVKNQGDNNCENYEKNLQKLEGQIRNHIRTHQQLKLYQDGLEEKIQEFKKQRKSLEKKYDSLKKKYQEIKNNASMYTDRITKFETENDKLKNQLKGYRSGLKVEEHRKLNRYESNKENLHQYRNVKHERASIEKKNQSTEKIRVSVNVKSSKGIPISSKILQDRNREEKNKAIRNRIGYGY